MKSKFKFFKLGAIAEHLQKMGDEASAQSERNQLRHLDFASKSDDKGTQIEGTIKSAMMLKTKFEAANQTAVVYKNSYDFANCDRVLEEEQREGMKTGEEAAAEAEAEEGSDDKQAQVEMCRGDKSIAEANEQASKTAKTQHMDELTHLGMLRKEHEEAVAGAKAAADMRDADKKKAQRLHAAAAAIQADADQPCDIGRHTA